MRTVRRSVEQCERGRRKMILVGIKSRYAA